MVIAKNNLDTLSVSNFNIGELAYNVNLLVAWTRDRKKVENG